MLNSFTLVHRANQKPFLAEVGPTPQGWFHLVTCLRQVLAGPFAELGHWQLEEDDVVLTGTEAYTFLLEVVCGLHSPLIGETEILGQFKAVLFKSQRDAAAAAFDPSLKRILGLILEDTKKVRQTHLLDLGSQSYGSLLRRELKHEKEIHVLGAGLLVKDILPWIAKDSKRVHLHVRDAEKVKIQFADARISSVNPLLSPLMNAQNTTAPLQGALIIAAPVDDVWLQAWLKENGSDLGLIFDLRAVDQSHASNDITKTVTLNELFQHLNVHQEKILERKRLALEMIQNLSQSRSHAIEYRPFGWEDVCA